MFADHGIENTRGKRCEKTTPQPPRVLYCDYNNLWYPLSELYWSSSSSLLVSHHPMSSVEEIISMYCPQCLTRFTEDDAASYQNRCPVCFECPVCTNTLVAASVSLGKVALACSSCFYRSDCCGLIGSDKQEIDSAIIERERENPSIGAFAKMQTQLQSFAGGRVVGQSEQPPLAPDTSHKAPLLLQHDLPLSDADLLDASQRSHTIWHRDSLLLSHSVPPRVRLRSKRTLRCRLDVEQSKMSIIVQPKTFPLEGDSSLKIQRGKWWVKDSSAIHVVPRMIITTLPNMDLLFKGETAFLQLEMSNPQDSPIVVALTCFLSKSTLLPNMPPQNDGSEELCVTLGAFEDELLREASGEEANADISDQVAEQLEALQNQGAPASSMKWLVACAHNSMALIVPLRLTSDTNTPTVERPTLALQLTLNQETKLSIVIHL